MHKNEKQNYLGRGRALCCIHLWIVNSDNSDTTLFAQSDYIALSDEVFSRNFKRSCRAELVSRLPAERFVPGETPHRLTLFQTLSLADSRDANRSPM